MRYILIILLLSACGKVIVKQREAESLQEHGMMRVQIIIGGAIKTDTQSILLDLNKMRWHSTGIGGEATPARFKRDDLEMLSLSARNDLRKLYWHALIFGETRAGQTPEQLRTLWWEELGLSKPVNN